MMAAVARPFASAVAGRAARAAVDLPARAYVLTYIVARPPAPAAGADDSSAGGGAGATEIVIPHLFVAGDVTVELSGLRRGAAAATVVRRPGGPAGPGTRFAGRTEVSVRASAAAAGETLVVRIRPAAGGAGDG
jgi:hypothetical protein